MEPEVEVHNRTKVNLKFIAVVVAVCAGLLFGGMVLLDNLQSHLIESRQAVLFNHSYISTTPFGAKVERLNAFPQFVWLNYEVTVPKECNVTVNTWIRHKPNAKIDAYMMTTVDDPRLEFHALETDEGKARKISWLLTFSGKSQYFTAPGYYELVRTSRFRCGESASNNLTATQIAGFWIGK